MLHATYAELSRLLHDIGFTSRSEPGRGFRYEHPANGMRLIYPDYAPDEEVVLSDLAGTRMMLELRGLMPREEFDRKLKKVPVAG